MTDRATLIALAERLEKASGPLEILDCDIWDMVRGAVTPWGEKHTGPAYTASLDAAMTLVPDGYCWTINTFAEPNKSASAYLIRETNAMVRPERQYIATPALSLCAAALRARADEIQARESLGEGDHA